MRFVCLRFVLELSTSAGNANWHNEICHGIALLGVGVNGHSTQFFCYLLSFRLLHSGDYEIEITPFLLTFSRIMECHGNLGSLGTKF